MNVENAERTERGTVPEGEEELSGKRRRRRQHRLRQRMKKARAPREIRKEGISIVEWLTPEFTSIAVDFATRLRLGATPVELSGGALTKKEAVEWLKSGADISAEGWFCRKHDLPTVAPDLFTWLRRVLDTPEDKASLFKERTIRIPNGEDIKYRFSSKVDEVRVEDLAFGIHTTVRQAFSRAEERWEKAAVTNWIEDHRPLCSLPEWKTGTRVAMLNTAAQFMEEGRALCHCLERPGMWVDSTRRGRSIHLSIHWGEHRSTAEISPQTGEIFQHKGPHNCEPHDACAAVLRSFLRRNCLPAFDGGLR